MRELLHTTEALCPQCLVTLPAEVFADEDGQVWMERTCESHGKTVSRVWHDSEHYMWLRSLAFPKTTPHDRIAVSASCPFGCGPCGRHSRQGTLLEIEVTQSCNLRCPVCFMSARKCENDPSLEEIRAMYEAIAKVTSLDAAVQITGGEPTVRPDLPQIVRMGREMGFWGIEINTNGLVIAQQDGYLESLKDAGCTGIYLSFDGLDGACYEATCGVDILPQKLQVIQRCREANVQCVLAMTIISGLNDSQLGDVVRFCIENDDVVAGLALQPAFISGRFESGRVAAFTMGDVIRCLDEQTGGLIRTDDIWPLGCSHPICDTGTFLIKDPSISGHGGYIPATRDLTAQDYRTLYNPDSPQGSVFLDILEKQGRLAYGGISIIIMNYMDAYSCDLERLRECSMFVTVPDGRTIPFCSYHMTDCDGRRVFAPWCKPSAALGPLFARSEKGGAG